MKVLLEVMCGTVAIFIVMIGFSKTAQASQDIPETIVLDRLQQLYEPVVFEHQMHAEMFDCSDCHHHLKGTTANENCMKCHSQETPQQDASCSDCHFPEYAADRGEDPKDTGSPGQVYHIDIPRLKGALHLQCVGCHRAGGGPTGCEECHAFTESGKKRFRVKQ